MVEIGGLHEAEHRPEALRSVKPRTWLDADSNSRRPEIRLVIDECRFDQPGLTWLELVERTLQPLVRRPDQGAENGAGFIGTPDSQ